MFCKECGKKVSDDSKFCRYCGTELAEENDIQFKSCLSAFDNLYDDTKVSKPISGPADVALAAFFGILEILAQIVD